MMRAAVLGASGMLGATLVKALARRGVEVVRVGRGATDDVPFDLREAAVPPQAAAHPVDVFFHCGATFAGDDAAGVEENQRANAASAPGVAALLASMQCRHLVYAGTVSSYATGAELGSYGLSKAHAEEWLAWSLGRAEGGFCSLRLSQLYDSEGRCCAHQPWFGRIIAYTARGLPLRLPPGADVRSFLHVDDAAALMVAAAQAGIQGIWPVCHPDPLPYPALAALSREVFDTSSPIDVDASKRAFRPSPVIDSSALFARVGVQALTSVREGLLRIRGADTAGRFGPLDVL
jgi:nucleoside-diphosphate-sugar epimerase